MGRSGGPLRNWGRAGNSQQSTFSRQLAPDELPRVRGPEKQGALAATDTARSRKSRPRCASACLQRRKPEPTKAGGVDRGVGRDAYTPTGTMEQHSLPSSPIAEPNAEGHIWQATQKEGTEEQSRMHLGWKRGNAPKVPAGRHHCKRNSYPRRNLGR